MLPIFAKKNLKRPETNESGSRHVYVDNGASCSFECRRPSLIRLWLNVRELFHNSCSIELEKPLVGGEKLIISRRLNIATSLITFSVKLFMIYLCRFMNYLLTRGIYGNNKLCDVKTNAESFFPSFKSFVPPKDDLLPALSSFTHLAINTVRHVLVCFGQTTLSRHKKLLFYEWMLLPQAGD